MRNPARLFAAALTCAMAAIAAVALLVDLFGHSAPGRAPVRSAAAVQRTEVVDGAPPAPGGPVSSSHGAAPASPADATESAAASSPPKPAASGGASPAATGRPAVRTRAAAGSTGTPRFRAVSSARPGGVSRSHYLRHITGVAAIDVPRMLALGGADGLANASGQRHIVLLDIGGQRGDGVLLSTTPRWVSYDGLARALAAYVHGYHASQRRNAPVVIAIGTNNDLQTSNWTGRQWAQQVVEPVRRAAAGFRYMVIAGADDIEPGFHAGVQQTKDWVSGFLAASKAPLIFNGSADGCPTDVPNARCGHHWTAADLAWVAGGASKRISALPQVYSTVMAQQWAMIALTATDQGYGPLRFRGPLTENGACRGVKACPTMGSTAAWNALSASLRLVGGILAPIRSDLDVK